MPGDTLRRIPTAAFLEHETHELFKRLLVFCLPILLQSVRCLLFALVPYCGAHFSRPWTPQPAPFRQFAYRPVSLRKDTACHMYVACHIQRQPRKELRLGSTIWPDRHSHIGCTLSQSKTRVSHGYHTCTLSYSDDLGSEPVQCLLAYVSRNSMTGKAGLADCIHVVCCGVSVPIMMTPIP